MKNELCFILIMLSILTNLLYYKKKVLLQFTNETTTEVHLSLLPEQPRKKVILGDLFLLVQSFINNSLAPGTDYSFFGSTLNATDKGHQIQDVA